MNILIVTPHYPPDGGPSSPLFAMLAEELVRIGHQVTVIAAVPHYPTGRVPREFRGFQTKRSTEKGVEILRVPVPSLNRGNLSLRLLQFFCFQIGMTWAGLRRKFDVLLTSNPALQVGLPFLVLGSLRRKPAVFSVHDVYPDAGIELGVFRSPAVIALVTLLEKACLRRADKVRILSDSFAAPMKRMGVPDEKRELIYDWVDTDLIRPLSKENDFAREHGLAEKFVLLYAGNIGLSQGLELVLTAAERLAPHEDVRFVFVGEGASRDNLITEAKRRRLKNVSFFPFQPREHLPEVLATADVSLVVLKKGIGFRSLPSKSYSILASGRPIVASVDEGSDSWKLIERCGGGICVPPEDPDRLTEAILRLKSDPVLRRELGAQGREYAERHHSPQAAAALFEKLLGSLCASPKETSHGS